MEKNQRQEPAISYHRTGPIAIIELSNPSRHNALTRQMCISLKNTMQQLESDDRVEVIALRGANGDFSAGASIDHLPSILFDDTDGPEVVDHLSSADQAICETTKPTVALVEGTCMGGGWQLASACDFILSSSTAKFAITPAKIGIVYPEAGIRRLILAVGPARAKYILMTGRAFSAQQAFTLGLIADLVEAEAFEDESWNLLQLLVSRSRFSQVRMNSYIDKYHETPELAHGYWKQIWQEMFSAGDMHIGIDSFKRKETPAFLWRTRSQT